MKYVQAIQQEFIKMAVEMPEWWQRLTYEEQMIYYKAHPATKLRPTVSNLPPEIRQRLVNRKKYQGALSDAIVKSHAYKRYVDNDRPGGYYGSSERTPNLDSYVEGRLRALGLGDEGAASWLCSGSANHMMDDTPTKQRVDDYTRNAFMDVLVWNHPDHVGSVASSIDLRNKIKKNIGAAGDIDFNPEEKSIQAMLKLSEGSAKVYLTKVGEFLQDSFDIKDQALPQLQTSENVFSVKDKVRFAEPIKIKHMKFNIGMNLNYPKIRCTSVQGETLDSQTPRSLARKIRRLIEM